MTPAPDTIAAPARSDGDLADALRARGQRVTSQRLVIHRALREFNRHVSAEQVLDAVRPRLPGVSLPTVYATLELFEDLGVVRRLSRAHGPALYDPRTEPHHHLACSGCGRIQDVEADVDTSALAAAARRQGFRSSGSEVVLTGLCAECAAASR
jgi:Fur family ferric uptake transcriptional regulator/Fur family peroxide stress response transcriptional regulator